MFIQILLNITWVNLGKTGDEYNFSLGVSSGFHNLEEQGGIVKKGFNYKTVDVGLVLGKHSSYQNNWIVQQTAYILKPVFMEILMTGQISLKKF